MFHKAVKLNFLSGTSLEVTFQNGVIKRYDVKQLFKKYPQLQALEDRDIFLSGKLQGFYGIVWNDELDIEVETIYEEGSDAGTATVPVSSAVADAVYTARAAAGMSQCEVSQLSGIDQADISRIERGTANPSVSTLERIAKALGGTLNVSISIPNEIKN
jgi:DNA-binding XRE family transcriptional regulator